MISVEAGHLSLHKATQLQVLCEQCNRLRITVQMSVCLQIVEYNSSQVYVNHNKSKMMQKERSDEPAFGFNIDSRAC